MITNYAVTWIKSYIFYVKVPDSPVFKHNFRCHCHSVVPKVLGVLRPVFLTFHLWGGSEKTITYVCVCVCACVRACVCQSILLVTDPSLLITACQHDQCLDVLLPDHPPELVDGAGQRTLGSNVLLLGVETLFVFFPNKHCLKQIIIFHPLFVKELQKNGIVKLQGLQKTYWALNPPTQEGFLHIIVCHAIRQCNRHNQRFHQ